MIHYEMLINQNWIYLYIYFLGYFPYMLLSCKCFGHTNVQLFVMLIKHIDRVSDRKTESEKVREWECECERERDRGSVGGCTTCLDGGYKAAGERQSLFSFGRNWLSCNTSLIHVTNTQLPSHTDTPRHS